MSAASSTVPPRYLSPPLLCGPVALGWVGLGSRAVRLGCAVRTYVRTYVCTYKHTYSAYCLAWPCRRVHVRSAVRICAHVPVGCGMRDAGLPLPAHHTTPYKLPTLPHCTMSCTCYSCYGDSGNIRQASGSETVPGSSLPS
jgi:hypothetical protein